MEPIIIVGFFTAASGLGELARMLYDAYARQGAKVYAIDLSLSFRQGTDVPFDFVDGRSHRGPGTVILSVNAPLVPLALGILGRKFLAHKWRIGYWAWELPALPPEWCAGAELVHEIWTISSFSARAMESHFGQRVQVVLPPVSTPVPKPNRAAARRRDSRVDFIVLLAFNMASSFARKNPLASISAFKAAFGHDAGALLLVKITHAHAYPEGARAVADACQGHDNVKVLSDMHSGEAPIELLAEADVLLSLHRAEGLGLLFVHAMQLGKPVVATGWSGNLDILTANNACLVPATLVPAHDPQGTYDWPHMLWADASVPAAAAALRQLRSQPALRSQKGAQAQADARRLFGQPQVPAIPRRHAKVRAPYQPALDVDADWGAPLRVDR